MLSGSTILLAALLYIGLLFAIAYYGDRRADAGRSIIATPYVYALSIAVYCTSWTFFGSVGRAVSTGVGFLPIYLGPTLAFIFGWLMIRKMIRISKANRITSIADFIASRYGKSFELGILVSVIAVVGILPYISLQLKAISASYSILSGYPEITKPAVAGVPILADTELFVSLVMAAFAILFGTRHIDASERHEGMVAAIAFESVVKLTAFVAVGVFVTYGLYAGFSDIFARAEAIRRACPSVHHQWRRGSYQLVHPDAAGDGRRRRAAPPISGPGGRKCRRASPEEGDVAVSALSASDQHLRAANRLRRPAAVSRRSRRRHVRAYAADEGAPAAAGAADIHWRTFGRNGHDHRRKRGARHHGLQ